ncbi:YolD-like family protein [Brevibacillus humidisoli]|uniref:YolD-like family protein n=1 Tax=Brevibacillus humidisoli TaxID=2895522 RepID=UPI001E3BFA1C|nr:YolD-like family protein [Brevibacillus humidisoli]UFJ40081.1 YolD-like family protein [Brevibacillus humidisoli]
MKSVSKKDSLFEASRSLPEQHEGYLKMNQEQELVAQPIIEEDEVNKFNRIIYDSVHRDYAVTVRSWVPVSIRPDLGEIKSVWGRIKRIDATNQQIKIVNDEGTEWIDMNRIVAIWKNSIEG